MLLFKILSGTINILNTLCILLMLGPHSLPGVDNIIIFIL